METKNTPTNFFSRNICIFLINNFDFLGNLKKGNTTLFHSIQIQIGCLMTSRVISQEGYAQSISFYYTVSLSQAQHRECLLGILCIGQPTSTDFQVVFFIHQIHSPFIHHYFDFFVRYNWAK